MVKRISSFWTPLSKWIFTAIFLGILAVVCLVAIVDGKLSTQPSFFVGPTLAAVFVYVLQRVLASDLADEVLDFGEYLVVRHGKRKDRVYLRNLIKVEVSKAINPQRMTLHLVEPSLFGRLISFSPVSSKSFNPFGQHQLVEELMSRAQEARAKNAA
jgi:hypothetical protein